MCFGLKILLLMTKFVLHLTKCHNDLKDDNLNKNLEFHIE